MKTQLSTSTNEDHAIGSKSASTTKEQRRLLRLKSFEVLDSRPEKAFDDLAKLAAKLCLCPVASVNFVDEDRVWFKAPVGIPFDTIERCDSFCEPVVQSEQPLMVVDLKEHPRFSKFRHVQMENGLRFYAGVPITTADGLVVGTLCVLDFQPRNLDLDTLDTLAILARQVVDQLELRLSTRTLENKQKELMTALASCKAGSWNYDRVNRKLSWDEATRKLFKLSIAETSVSLDSFVKKYFAPENHAQIFDFFESRAMSFCAKMVLPNNESIWIESSLEAKSDLTTLHGIWTDVTSRRSSEQTIEAQSKALVEQFRMASLGEMAGGFAHAVGNPLAVILGRLEQLKSMATAGDVSREDILKIADRSLTSCEKVKKTLEGLRSFAGDHRSEPTREVAVDSVLKTSLDFCRDRMTARGIRFDFDAAPSATIHLECRALQIGQMLFQLMSNALKAAQLQEDKWVKLEAFEREQRIYFVITDSSLGQDPNLRENFARPQIKANLGEGLSVGLSICREVVESHGGILMLDSESKFTRFVVDLPKHQPVAKTA